MDSRIILGNSPVTNYFPSVCVYMLRFAFFGIGALRGGTVHLKLNIVLKPIANKYHEGKMKSTLKRELNSV